MEERIVGLKLTREEDKYSLHFHDGEGRFAVINIDEFSGGHIATKCIKRWAEEQFLIGGRG